MSNALSVINQTLNSEKTMGNLIMALGGKNGDPESLQEAKRYAASVLAEIEKTAGDPKKDLTVCHPNSIAQTMIDAARFKMFIDGRQHAHIVKYGNSATLQIGYRGYLAKIKEHYPDADFTVELIFEGDDLQIWDENGFQNYTLKKASAFAQDIKNFLGVLVVISYTNGSSRVQKVSAVTKARIDRARKAAKQDFVWSSDYFEKAKAAAIKSACKIHFAAIQGLQEVIRYDNEHNYNIEKPQEDVRAGSIIENLNDRLAAPEPSGESGESSIVDADFSDVSEETEEPEAATIIPATAPRKEETPTQRTARKIINAMLAVAHLADLYDLWEADYKEDIAAVKAESEATYKYLVEKYQERQKALEAAR